MKPTLLTLNGGSSSLKLALYELESLRRLTVAKLDLGEVDARPIDAALAKLDREQRESVVAVGHRVVHGGRSFDGPRRVTKDVIVELKRLAPLDPDHLPAEVALIEAAERAFPNAKQVVCFDTAFHRTMPRVNKLLAIPREYEARGVERFGFHGLSYAYLIEELARVAGDDVARGKVVLAHLGSGASLCALRDKKSVDTTMGFTPASGIMMSTRSGDLDPGVLVYLAREEKLDADALDELVNKRSGLLGVGGSADMRDLLEREDHDPRAKDAVDLFCHAARKAIGALATAIGGLDTLVFSGGIGERSAVVRVRIARGLEHLGVTVDDGRNQRNASVISSSGAGCTVRVLETDEEAVIARETRAIVNAKEEER